MTHSYEYYVKEGKKLLHATEVYQVMIAYYASCVCEIKHGGKSKGYTLSQYAEDIGMHRKTLSDWSYTYRHVIEKLGMDPSNVTQEEWSVAKRVSSLLRNEKKAIQDASGMKRRKGRGWNFSVLIPGERVRDMFNAESMGRSAQSKIHSYTDTVIGMKNMLRRMHLDSVSTASLRSLKKNLDEASSELTTYLLENKGVSIHALQESHH